MDASIVRTLGLLAQVLEKLGVPYAVGGSVASGVHGLGRSTQDIDVLVDLGGWHVGPLLLAMGPGWYIDRDMVDDAISRRASFNAIHAESGLKIDFFLFDDSPLNRSHLARRVKIPLGPGDAPQVYFSSPEDIVLQKLAWYRASDGVLGRQLQDVAGVLKVQGSALDLAYLREMARRLGLADLLASSLSAAGLPAQ